MADGVFKDLELYRTLFDRHCSLRRLDAHQEWSYCYKSTAMRPPTAEESAAGIVRVIQKYWVAEVSPVAYGAGLKRDGTRGTSTIKFEPPPGVPGRRWDYL